jgi:hypothetical protein
MTTKVRTNIDPSDISGALADFTSATNAITAYAGGGQTNAVALTSTFNRVTTVGTAADSVKLPAAKAGMSIVVFNKAASNSLNVFPASGDSINALSADAAYALAVTKGAMFVCCLDGKWDTILTA